MGPMSYIFGPSPLGRSVPSEDGRHCYKIMQVRAGMVRAYWFHLCHPIGEVCAQ